MSNTNAIYKPEATALKGKEVKKKKIKFGFVETKYYERMPGFVTTKDDVQIISSYEPFATTKEKFKENLTDDSPEKKTDWFEQTEDKLVESKQSKGEKMNEFYNIRGVATKRCSELSLNVEERLRLLLEGEVQRKEIEKIVEEQNKFIKNRKILEEKIKAKKYRDKETTLLQDEYTAANAEEKEELEGEIAETVVYFDKQEKQDLEHLSELLEEDNKILFARYDRLMTNILSEIHQKENDESSALTQNIKDLVLSGETWVKGDLKKSQNKRMKNGTDLNKRTTLIVNFIVFKYYMTNNTFFYN